MSELDIICNRFSAAVNFEMDRFDDMDLNKEKLLWYIRLIRHICDAAETDLLRDELDQY